MITSAYSIFNKTIEMQAQQVYSVCILEVISTVIPHPQKTDSRNTMAHLTIVIISYLVLIIFIALYTMLSYPHRNRRIS